MEINLKRKRNLFQSNQNHSPFTFPSLSRENPQNSPTHALSLGLAHELPVCNPDRQWLPPLHNQGLFLSQRHGHWQTHSQRDLHRWRLSMGNLLLPRWSEDHSTYVSVFVALASEGTDVRSLFELTLLDQSGKGKHKVHSHFDRALESGPYTLKYRGSMWGYKRFFRRTMLETSDFLKDDCLKINCTVGVVVSEIDCPRLHSIQVPESDIGSHFGMLLENEEGSDITFNVFGEKFHAHKLVLAARSPVFEAEFSDRMEEDDNEIVVTGMEPRVFKALLHFIYRDSLIDDEEFAGTSSSCMPSIPDALTAKLLAAADKYDLPRLRLMCESVLCKDVSVNSVANILALADRHHAMDLKAVCLKFAAENLVAVMRSDGFEYLKENCPSLQSEILKTVAGCEEEFSGGGKSRSVWAQFSDGGDTINRSVRQQTWENGGEQNQGVWVQIEEGGGEGSPGQEE